MNDRTRLIAIIAIPLLTLALYFFLTILFDTEGRDNVAFEAGVILYCLDRLFGALRFLPPWISWGILLFVFVAGARFLLWENEKVSEGQRVAVVVSSLVLLLLAVVIPTLLGAGSAEKGAWWRPDTHRAAGTERVFDKITFVWAPAGQYMKGSPDTETARDKDEVQQEVHFPRGFWISCKEISVDQYKEVVGNIPNGMADTLDKPDLPVTGVSYEESLEFCKKLMKKGNGIYRLPTENEWEYACRAGTTTPWSCGEDATQLPEFAWYNVNSEREPHPVGSLKANPWGIHHMHGNAAEWCQSDGESGKLVYRYRGGEWMDDAAHCRSAARGIFTHLIQFMGLRIVREP